jgi:hypothetical protein
MWWTNSTSPTEPRADNGPCRGPCAGQYAGIILTLLLDPCLKSGAPSTTTARAYVTADIAIADPVASLPGLTVVGNGPDWTVRAQTPR